MQFGVREICNVVFKAKTAGKIGSMSYVAGQPVLYIDSAKTSTLEGASSTVYATGGRGNSRLIAWEGEKTLTFTVEDALLSDIGFAVLSGAGLFKKATGEKVYVHQSSTAYVEDDGKIDLTSALNETGSANDTDKIHQGSPVFVMAIEYGTVTGMISGATLAEDGKSLTVDAEYAGKTVLVDYYVERAGNTVSELVIDMNNFAGYYYVEASTLFRRQEDGKDLAAELVFPNIKVQSNFTFNMSATGDPSTFTFTMDALPGYTRFDRSKKVLCAMYIVDENVSLSEDGKDSINQDADSTIQYPINN